MGPEYWTGMKLDVKCIKHLEGFLINSALGW